MPIEVTTLYDKARMLRYHDHTVRSKKTLWIMMAVCTLLVIGCHWYLSYRGMDTYVTRLCLILILVWDGTYILFSFLLPRLMVKNSPSLNMSLRYSFREEEVEICGETANRQENSTLQYAAFTKVKSCGSDLYLYVSSRQALIVDTSGLDGEKRNALKALLESRLGSSRVKW